MQRIFHSFALLVSLSLCGAILGGVIGSILADTVLGDTGFGVVSTVITGISAGGGFGLVTGAAIALRAPIDTLSRYSRIAMVLAILFLAMLLVRRYRIERQLDKESIELVPV